MYIDRVLGIGYLLSTRTSCVRTLYTCLHVTSTKCSSQSDHLISSSKLLLSKSVRVLEDKTHGANRLFSFCASLAMGNQLPVFNRLEVPSFGLVWLTLDDSLGDAFVLIPGGGGSTKSGVKNQIQIGRIIDDKVGGIKFLKRFETDVDGKSVLCSGVAVGTCMGTKVVCALLDNICAILTAEKVGDDLVLKRVADFKADFSEDGSVNCACILPSGHIVTGGDDGICRLWAVGYIKDEDTTKPHIWRVRMLSMMKGHTAAIMDISYHPHDALVSRVSRVPLTVFTDQFLFIRGNFSS